MLGGVYPYPHFNEGHRLGIDLEAQALKVLVYLLELGVDPNAQDRHGRTPLHKACKTFSPAVPLLLASGADPNARDNGGTTPLNLACAHADLETVQLMLTHGADLCAADQEGLTPLDYAAKHENEDVVQHLRALGAKSGKSE